MRKLPVIVVAALVAALGLVTACGVQQAETEREHTNVAISIDDATLNQALLPLAQVQAATGVAEGSELQEVGTLADDIHPESGASSPTYAGSAELGQNQPLPGVTWAPAECAQMIEAAVLDFGKVDGHPVVRDIATTREVTPAQIGLAWLLAHVFRTEPIGRLLTAPIVVGAFVLAGAVLGLVCTTTLGNRRYEVFPRGRGDEVS